MAEKQYTKIKNRLNSKALLIAGVIILILLSINFIRSWNRGHEITQEISDLGQEISNLEKNNLELSGLIQYLNSTAYIEQKARTELGFKKEGEKIIIIPEVGSNSLSDLNSDTMTSIAQTQQVSNPKKWWQYFFTKN